MSVHPTAGDAERRFASLRRHLRDAGEANIQLKRDRVSFAMTIMIR